MNLGFVIGPILSGILADWVGYIKAFSLLGWICMIVTLLVLFLAPKKILVKV